MKLSWETGLMDQISLSNIQALMDRVRDKKIIGIRTFKDNQLIWQLDDKRVIVIESVDFTTGVTTFTCDPIKDKWIR